MYVTQEELHQTCQDLAIDWCENSVNVVSQRGPTMEKMWILEGARSQEMALSRCQW